MADTKSRQAKLRAIIAPGSGASDGERSNARTLLARLEAQAELRAAPAQEYGRRTRPSITIEVDDFLRTYRPGFSNAASRRPGRPIVDEVDRIRRDGSTTGHLRFGDELAAGLPRALDSAHGEDQLARQDAVQQLRDPEPERSTPSMT